MTNGFIMPSVFITADLRVFVAIAVNAFKFTPPGTILGNSPKSLLRTIHPYSVHNYVCV